MSELPTGTVTFLFTDIEASTRLLQHLGDAGYAQALAEHRRLLRAAFVGAGGHELETQGDGFLVVFDRAIEAVRSAVAGQRALQAHPWPEGGTMLVRMALHSGEPIGATEGYVGLDLHKVQRICNAGHGRQILLSETTRSLIEPALQADMSLRDLGVHRLKDLQRPERIYQLLQSDLPVDFPSLRSLDSLPNNLPHQLTSFVGREREMTEVNRLLSTTRLLTLTGSGGCGKTRLAIQVGADLVDTFEDGVWLVELAALVDHARVPQAVASAIGVREQPGRPLLATVSDYLQARHLLLVLDNCEHLLAACAHLTYTLLSACPRVLILATSREPLGITGETSWRVPSLSAPDPSRLPPPERLPEFDAVRLFVDRATAVLPTFRITSQGAPFLAQICHRLDGIPLAIELAAARVKVLTVEQIARRLDDLFHLLTGGSRTALLRQQTLRATMDWSHALLSPREQTIFRRLSVFAGGWTLDAAETVCASPPITHDQVFDLLSLLVDKSLVVVDDQGSEKRYRMLEIVRQYAREKLKDVGEDSETRRRHCGWFLDLAEQAEPMLLGPGEQWLDLLEVEHDNLRAAMELSLRSGEKEAGLRLAGALRRFWMVRGYWTEGRQRLEAALALENGAAPLRSKALAGAASLAQSQGDYQRAEALSRESLAIQREQQDHRGIADSLNILGIVMLERSDYSTARQFLEESLANGEEAGDRHVMASALINLANVAEHEGAYERAARLCDDSLALFRAIGDKRGSAFALNMLGVLASDHGDDATAQVRFEEGLAMRRELGDRRGIAGSLSQLGLVARKHGDYELARTYYDESLAIQRELGDRRGIATTLRNLGLVAWHQGAVARAAEFLEESLIMRKAQGNRTGIAECLEGLARVAEPPERAAKLLGAATALREAVGTPLPPAERSDHDRLLEAVRTPLGPEAFAAAWDQGRAMSLEDAVGEALRSPHGRGLVDGPPTYTLPRGNGCRGNRTL